MTTLTRLNHFPLSVLVAIGLAVACHDGGKQSRSNVTTKASGPDTKTPSSGDATGDDESKDQAGTPVPSTGTYLADYDHTRVRCDYQQSAPSNYTALCVLIVRQSDGRELQAQSLQADLTLRWLAPAQLRGSVTFDQCVAAANSLSFRCGIALSNPTALAEVKLGVSLADALHPQRVESTSLLLPFSVGVAAGFVPSIPYSYQGLKTEAQAVGAAAGEVSEMGYQMFDIPSEESVIIPESICHRGERLFFSNTNSIFELTGGRVRLYAGSANAANTQLGGGKLRVYMEPTQLVCTNDAIFVASPKLNKIHKIYDSGQVELIAGGDQSGSTPDGAPASGAPINGLGPIGVRPNGEVLFVEVAARRLRVVNADGRLKTLALGPTSTAGGNGPTLATAPFNTPVAAALAPDGSFYVVDTAVHSVVRFSASGQRSIAAGTGTARYNEPNNPRALSEPYSLTITGSGSIYVGERFRGIKQILADGTLQQVVSAGPDILMGYDELLHAKEFQYRAIVYVRPFFRALDVSSAGELMTGGPYGLLRYPAGAATPTAIAGQTTAVVPDCSLLQNTKTLHLFDASAIAFAPDRHLVVGDWLANNNYDIVFRNLVHRDAATYAAVFAGCHHEPLLVVNDDDAAFIPYVTSIGSIAFSPSGALYWANTEQNRIVKIASDGSTQVVAGNGTVGSSGDGGPASSAAVRSPDGLTFAPDGSLYFAERAVGGGSRIRRITKSGMISTVAGSGVAGDDGDGGPALAAKLQATSVAVGQDGRMFIADVLNHKIKMVDRQGRIHTIAGPSPNAPSGPVLVPVDAMRADVDTPAGIAVTNDGTLYFVNYGLGRIEEMHERADGTWTLATLFGTAAAGECGTGRKPTVAAAGNVESAIKNSLSIICEGQPQAIAVHDTCPSSGGDTRIAINQTFGDWANVVEIVRPCQP